MRAIQVAKSDGAGDDHRETEPTRGHSCRAKPVDANSEGSASASKAAGGATEAGGLKAVNDATNVGDVEREGAAVQGIVCADLR
jgi:hypothetical protein